MLSVTSKTGGGQGSSPWRYTAPVEAALQPWMLEPCSRTTIPFSRNMAPAKGAVQPNIVELRKMTSAGLVEQRGCVGEHLRDLPCSTPLPSSAVQFVMSESSTINWLPGRDK